MSDTPIIKWKLAAWPQGKRYEKVNGQTRSLVLWAREYLDEKTARRAAPQIHRRYRDAVIELQPFKFEGFFWVGDSRSVEQFYWCPCRGLLDWVDDQWHCRRCGDEWHDEQVRPAKP